MLASEGPEFDEDSGDDRRWPAPDPDDRLWRHPSEIPKSSASTARSLRRGRLLGGAFLVAGLAGAGVALLFNGLVIGNAGRPSRIGSPILKSIGSAPSPAPQTSQPTSGPTVGVGPGVISLIMSRLPGIVAVDVAGPDGTQQGTGLILQPDGVILTTSQLVGGATTITVTSSDGREWNANLVGTDSTTGTAVIRVPANGLTVIPVDSSKDLRAGALSVVLSANSRPGRRFEASIGLFSGVNQDVDLGNGDSVPDAIVTDSVPPNPMGAILLDDQGKVVGVLRSVISDKGATSAVATPIALSKEAAARLLAGQAAVHSWLGLTGSTVAPAPSHHEGALVAAVTPASPAALAGIRPGDVVTAINGQTVPSMAALTGDVKSLPPGTSVILSIDRAGATLDLSTTLQGQPGNAG